MSPFLFVLMQFAILAYALVGGVFLAFSFFIMRSLSLTGGTGGVEAMQVINREVFRWVFMALFLGMAAMSLAIAGYGVANLNYPAGALILTAGLVYLIGCFIRRAWWRWRLAPARFDFGRVCTDCWMPLGTLK